MRLKELREAKAITQLTIATQLGITQQAYANYESGKRKPDPETLSKIADYFSVTTDYLLGRTDSRFTLPKLDNIFPIKKKQLPILGDIACGEPIFADEHFDSYLSVDEDIQADFCLRCKGDSMVGARIYDGDIVLIRKQSDVSDGEIAAVYIDGSATLKRIYKLPGKLILRAENPSYPPIEVTADNCETLIILGKAVAFYGLVK